MIPDTNTITDPARLLPFRKVTVLDYYDAQYEKHENAPWIELRSDGNVAIVELVPQWPDRSGPIAELSDEFEAAHTTLAAADRESYQMAYRICRALRREQMVTILKLPAQLEICQVGTGASIRIMHGQTCIALAPGSTAAPLQPKTNQTLTHYAA